MTTACSDPGSYPIPGKPPTSEDLIEIAVGSYLVEDDATDLDALPDDLRAEAPLPQRPDRRPYPHRRYRAAKRTPEPGPPTRQSF